jgi:hypothetical protein
MKNIITSLAIFLFLSTVGKAQILEVQFYDTVRLEVPANTLGIIQWQISNDGQSWEDLTNANALTTKQVILNSSTYFRAQITQQDCAPAFSNITQVTGTPVFLWSNPATWPNGKPTEGSNVIIPAGMTIRLDENPPALGGITINGELEFARKDLQLSAKWILVHGMFRIGTEQNPFLQKATVTLIDTNTNESIMGMGTRGIMVMGGQLEFHGNPPPVAWTKIQEHALAGATSIKVLEDVTWKAGDEIVIAPTDYYAAGNGASITQRLTLTQVTNQQLNFSSPLNAHRWGLLQYPTPTGMSLSPANVITPPTPDTAEKKTPLVLDERAEVGNLTRNIVIQAPNDNLWTTQGFGVHIMLMDAGSVAHVDGVEIRRGGQRGRLARYAFHWHQLSYSGTQTLADATGQYFINSTINSSANRGVVVHGTNGVLVKNNIIYDIRGHGIFTEDAVERRNTFDHNLVLYVRNSTQPLKIHEAAVERGSSGFWISNPDNIVINNVAADCRSIGYWLAFPAQPWGLNQNVVDTRDGQRIAPNRLLFGVFDNNTAHSNGQEGILIDDSENDNEGNIFPRPYFSTTNGRNPVWPLTTLKRFKLTNYRVWKNLDNGIWDRAAWVDNYGAVAADNCGRFFAGSGADGIIEHSLVIGTSLNHLMNTTGRPTGADFAAGHSSADPVAFATYHSAFDIKSNIVINFPAIQNTRSGVFATDDYYTRPVDKGHQRNTNNTLVNAHPGVKLMPPAPYTWFVLASALWDPYGIWGPANNYFVYDVPFLTHGKEKTIVNPSTAVAGGVSVSGPFYGFEGFVLHGVGDDLPQNQPYFDLMGLHVRRLNTSLNEVGTWIVPPPPNPTSLLQHMRHFATTPEGIYELTFPWEVIHPTNFQMTVENMLTTSDKQVIGIQFAGNINASVRLWVDSDTWFNYTNLGNSSIQGVIDSEGETFWQDKDNNRVWVKIRGGRWEFWTNNANEALPSSDELLYKPVLLRIF